MSGDFQRLFLPRGSVPLPWGHAVKDLVAEFVRVWTFWQRIQSLTTSATSDNPRCSRVKIIHSVAGGGRESLPL